MAKARKYRIEKDYVQVPNETAQAVEKKSKNPISLQALALITNIWSYNVEEWDLFKSELYKRFAKNKETSVKSAWDDLVEAGYILEFQFRNEKGLFDNLYYYHIKPFTEEQKKAIYQEVLEEYPTALENQVWPTAQENPVRKNGSGKPGREKPVISNKANKQSNKTKTNNKKDIVNKENLLDIINSFYPVYGPGRWTKKSWLTMANKLHEDIKDIKMDNPHAYINQCLITIADNHDVKRGRKKKKTVEELWEEGPPEE